jgi:hypothetical protein
VLVVAVDTQFTHKSTSIISFGVIFQPATGLDDSLAPSQAHLLKHLPRTWLSAGVVDGPRTISAKERQRHDNPKKPITQFVAFFSLSVDQSMK